MFTQKKSALFSVPVKTTKSTSTSKFVQAASKKSAETRSGNASLKYETTGDDFVDQFANVAQYLAPRSYEEISKDMISLWSTNKILTLCFVFYLRIITRVVQFFDNSKTEETQRGAGLKHESMVRMIWLHVNYTDTFWKNISLFISVGSWKDIFDMLRYDLMYNGWEDRQLDWDKMFTLISAGLENDNTSNLVKKYLPHISARSKCTTTREQANTIIAKWLSAKYSMTYKQYRLFKAKGTAHRWQQLISKHLMKEINFDTIHGRALAKLVSSKFLKNHGLEDKYAEWISTKPVAKFTGFVYELVQEIQRAMPKYKKDTINAQYQTLLELAKININESPYRPIGVLDCSGSMESRVYIGSGKVGKLSSIQMAMPLVIMLDDMLPELSMFRGNYLDFADRCKMHMIKGDNFVDKYLSTPRQGYGGTNFMSVFDLFTEIKRKYPDMPELDYPNMIVCFSDGEFNRVGVDITNVESGRQALKFAGFSEEFAESFGFCFVDIPNTFYTNYRRPKFETFEDVKNCYYFSGYDLSPLAFLFGVSKSSGKVPTSARELFDAAMSQEIMDKLEV
jgi:hypothetical protein